MAVYVNWEYRTRPHWVDAEGGHVPFGEAVAGGVDINGETLYIGRAWQSEEYIPGKVVPSHGVCYVPYAGQEHPHRIYQVLHGQGAEFTWVDNSNGNIPPGSVEGGRTSDGEKLYIGRVQHASSHCIGKIHPSHGKLYIPYGGQEIAYENYQILCMKSIALGSRPE